MSADPIAWRCGRPNAVNDVSTRKPLYAPHRRVQVYIPQSNSQDFIPNQPDELITYEKSNSSRIFLNEALSKHYLFMTMDESDMNRVIDCMQLMKYEEHDSIIEHGDFGNSIFCIEFGEAEEIVNGDILTVYGRGSCFGELGLMYNSAGSASVTATSTCQVWMLEIRYSY